VKIPSVYMSRRHLAHVLAFRPGANTFAESGATAAALALLPWALVSVIALPLFAGQPPQWTATGMRSLFPSLVGWVVAGGVAGVLMHALATLVTWRPEPEPVERRPPPATRIVILGGGFAGATTASKLEQAFGPDPSVSLTLVSDTNALLFTPMLAEVAASSLEATHISSPLRTGLRRTEVIRRPVADIDLAARRVRLAPDEYTLVPPEVPFDHLVLALGAVSNYLGLANVENEAFDFKTLADATRLRNHVIDMFERASTETDQSKRRAMLTSVVAGGGFAGAEVAGGLNDFARGMLAYYPTIPPEDVQIVLVHSRDRILPELSESLARYALEHMRARGVTFKLEARVADARRGVVVLNPAEEVPAHTLVWTAGTRPNPLLGTLGVDTDPRGAVVVGATLAVPGQPGVWALGDCAAVPDTRTGRVCAPTAQFAIREAATLAQNIHAAVRGRPMKSFHFDPLGTLCVVGHHTACAEIKGLRFSGLFAWMLWRTIYLAKLPGLERKAHVLGDWTIELFFPRDIAQTVDLTPRRKRT
jgi:NADH:ubiquinone reductase (H+-translocating)